MFVLDSVRKSYGAVSALDGVHCTLPAGQTTVLVGPSGSGKTTLLRLLNGLITPDAGSVRWGELEVTAQSAPGLRRTMGYVVQGGGLFPHLTAVANVTLVARDQGWTAGAMEARLQVLGAMVRLPREALERYPAELSGGQAQRVGLMRALMLDPQVLLLDEALGALDPLTRAELQRDLRALFATLRKTVVLVTHDLAEARFFADTLVVLRDGRIEQVGSPAEVAARPATPFVRALLGVPEQGR